MTPKKGYKIEVDYGADARVDLFEYTIIGQCERPIDNGGEICHVSYYAVSSCECIWSTNPKQVGRRVPVFGMKFASLFETDLQAAKEEALKKVEYALETLQTHTNKVADRYLELIRADFDSFPQASYVSPFDGKTK